MPKEKTIHLEYSGLHYIIRDGQWSYFVKDQTTTKNPDDNLRKFLTKSCKRIRASYSLDDAMETYDWEEILNEL